MRAALLALSLAACSTHPSAIAVDMPPNPATTLAGPGSADPFAPMPDTSEGLVNVSTTLDEVLEHGTLQGACDRFEAGATDRRSRLLCGKEMFFYIGLGGDGGIPTSIVKLMAGAFPDELGLGFSKLGMIEDPASADHLPLGLAPPRPAPSGTPSVVFTCASCHFARLPDGRYAVGAPNHGYEYGRHILSLAVFPLVALTGKPQDHDPQAIAAIQPLLDRTANDLVFKAQLIGAIAPLIGGSSMAPSFSKEVEGQYASWRSGTMDFVIAPLPFDDGVQVVTKMIALWGIPEKAEQDQAGMQSGMVAWTGMNLSLLRFVDGFVAAAHGSADWPEARLGPLVDYIYSLRAPANPSPPDPQLAEAGKALYRDKCMDCHAGPRGSGKRVYAFDEIGTDRELERWLDPQLTGATCCGAPEWSDEPLTHGVKSPRLTGSWALARFLHNGSVSTLEELFCVDGPRGTIVAPAFQDKGHDMTCDGLSLDEKHALIAYLRSN